MDIRIEAAWSDRRPKLNAEGTFTSVEVPYFVFNATDEDEAVLYAQTQIDAFYNGMALESIELAERMNDTTFKIRAIYKTDEKKTEDGLTYTEAFELGGGTQHLTESLLAPKRYPANAPDYGNLINYDGEEVKGVDIGMGTFDFSETHYYTVDQMSLTLRKGLKDYAWCTNSKPYRGFDPGEVLFIGCSGQYRESTGFWELTFKFKTSQNENDLTIGDITGIKKEGWQYMWVRYADKVVEGEIVKRPVAVYVHDVYESFDFARLGITQ